MRIVCWISARTWQLDNLCEIVVVQSLFLRQNKIHQTNIRNVEMNSRLKYVTVSRTDYTNGNFEQYWWRGELDRLLIWKLNLIWSLEWLTLFLFGWNYKYWHLGIGTFSSSYINCLSDTSVFHWRLLFSCFHQTCFADWK